MTRLLLCALLLVAATPLAAQERPDTTTLAALTDSLRALDSTLVLLEQKVGKMKTAREKYEEARRKAYRVEPMLALGHGLALLANTAFPIDRDPGGYEDRWTGADKILHANVGYGLTDWGIKLGGRPWVAASLTCLSAYAFEHTQAIGGGYVSNRDAVAGCAGAWAAVVMNRLAKAIRIGRGEQ